MSVRSIDIFDAKKVAARRLGELARDAGCELVLLDQSTVQVEQGWVFFYNFADFLSTGKASDALAGNGPLFVAFDGKLTELPSSKPWQRALDELAQARTPGET
jgi:hypothetical protein